jgi:hypothetical protein
MIVRAGGPGSATCRGGNFFMTFGFVADARCALAHKLKV